MSSKHCLQCGNEITSKYGSKFCCKSCANTYTNLHRTTLKTRMKKMICIKCGSEFDAQVNTPKSSAICQHCKTMIKVNKVKPKQTNNRKVYKKPAHRFICKFCGKEFTSKYKTATYCSTRCAATHKNLLIHSEKLQHYYDHQGEYVGVQDHRVKIFKADFINEQNGKCAICGMNQEWNGQPITFILDHIDGDATNNRRENLRCICPNCDSQLPTFKSRNKHSTRRDYYREKTIRLANEQS